MSPLPPPAEDQAYCTVSALETGLIFSDYLLFVDKLPLEVPTSGWDPALSFLLQNSSNNSRFLFDLGIWKDYLKSPPKVLAAIPASFKVEIPQDVEDALRRGGLTPLDIDTVCLSHVHFDHTGYSAPFTKSEFVLGGDTAKLFEKTGFYPANPESPFRDDVVPQERTRYLDESIKWEPIGPFPRAFDFYGDGSLYIIDAPGHMPGHINLLARTSADGGWIYLAGDSAHHWNLVTGESHIACNHAGQAFFHLDKKASEETIKRIREVMNNPRVRVLLAHDEPWWSANKGGEAFLPGRIQSL